MAKTLVGLVSSDKGDKTIVVTVAIRKTHPLYKKQYTFSKKFMAHDEKNEAHIGDKVSIAETRPISARKRYILEKVLEKALGLNPRYAQVHYNLGLTFYQRGRTDEAIHEFKKTLDLDSHLSSALYNLGLSYFRKGLYQEAIESYKEFLKSDPDYMNAHLNLGLAYGGLKQWDKAIEALEEELKYFPENFQTHVYLGIVYKETKDYSKALSHFKMALAHPDLPNGDWVRKAISSVESMAKKEERVRN